MNKILVFSFSLLIVSSINNTQAYTQCQALKDGLTLLKVGGVYFSSRLAWEAIRKIKTDKNIIPKQLDFANTSMHGYAGTSAFTAFILAKSIYNDWQNRKQQK